MIFLYYSNVTTSVHWKLPRWSFFKFRNVVLVVTVLPERHAPVAGGRGQKESVIVKKRRAKVDGRDHARVTTEHSDRGGRVKIPDTNDLVARPGGHQSVVVRDSLKYRINSSIVKVI